MLSTGSARSSSVSQARTRSATRRAQSLCLTIRSRTPSDPISLRIAHTARPRAGAEKSTPKSGVPIPSSSNGEPVSPTPTGLGVRGHRRPSRPRTRAPGRRRRGRWLRPSRLARPATCADRWRTSHSVATSPKRSRNAIVEHTPTAVRAIDMKPDATLASNAREVRDRVDTSQVHVTGAAHDGDLRAPCRRVRIERALAVDRGRSCLCRSSAISRRLLRPRPSTPKARPTT